MKIVVVEPPAPIVHPEDVPGVSAGDQSMAAIIAAATAEIDGPNGWLGRCLGVQTLRLYARDWCELPLRLPCPPLIDIVEISYIDQSRSQEVLDAGDWEQTSDGFVFTDAFQHPCLACRDDAVCVEFVAGYDGEDVAGGGTGDVPPQARTAIIMAASQIKNISAPDGQIKVDFVEGVGRTEYAVDEAARKIVTGVANRLLSGLQVYR